MQKPLVGISQCLTGDAVRYDGQSKPHPVVTEQLTKLFEIIPVCPEVEAGLPVPRPPVQLTGCEQNPQLIGRDDPSINITAVMRHYCQTRPAELSCLHGFIFKSRSPSCGLNSTPVFVDGQCITQTGRGIFARYLCETWPDLAVIEDSDLDNEILLDTFIRSVNANAGG